MNHSKVRLSAVYIICMVVFCASVNVLIAQKKNEKAGKVKSETALKVSSEKEAVWKYQSQNVSDELKLSKEKSARLLKAYESIRMSQRQAIKNLTEETDRDKSRAATLEVNKKERGKLETSLREILTEEQLLIALPLLGSFNNRWDTYVSTLVEFKLSKEKIASAMKLVNTYIIAYEKARAEATASGNRFSASTSRELKETLDAGLAKVLEKEQLLKWNEVTSRSKKESSKKDEGKSSQ